MVLLTQFLSRRRAKKKNARSEVANATGNVKYNLDSLCTSPSSVLVTRVLLKASHMVLMTYFRTETWRGGGGSAPLNFRLSGLSCSAAHEKSSKLVVFSCYQSSDIISVHF